MERRLGEIAAAVGGTVAGDADRRIRGVAPLDRAGPDELSFLANRRYRAAARASAAGAILVAPDEDLPERDLIRVADPYLALARALPLFIAAAAPRRGVHERAVIGADCRIGADPDIGPGAVVGDGCVIGARVRLHANVVLAAGVELGDDVTLHPQVTVYPKCRLGDRVVAHAGAVIGSDGFGYAAGEIGPVKVPQIGGVVIEDDVEIGAGTCIDRGALGDTRIGRGCKIDNLVQVAHNVEVGPGCLLAAQSGISGSTRLGAGVMMAGQSGIVGHVTLGDGARVAAKSAVTKSVPAGLTVAGVPAVDIRKWRRATAALSRLPGLLKKLSRKEGPRGE